jgi:poly(A) polymerase
MPPTLKQRIALFAQRLFGTGVPDATRPHVSAPPGESPIEGDFVPADPPPSGDPEPTLRPKARPRRTVQKGTGAAPGPVGPRVVPRAEHNISRANISPNALKVLYRLRQGGFQAHLVGGGVRDLLLGREPKDFDVATDAEPEEVRGVFRNCRLIGRRFRLAHVHFGPEIIEVATFRGLNPDVAEADRRVENGLIVRDNAYGTIEQDALRRDFTVNALYYDIGDFSVLDYTSGLDDLRAGRLRLIGDDPERRYREDPVRMLRAVRFACKLGFTIDAPCEQPLRDLGHLLQDIAAARLFDELLKLFQAGFGLDAFEKLRHYGLFGHLFPDTEDCLAREEHDFPITFVSRGLANTDARIEQDQPVTPAFLFAVLLWEPVRQRYQELLDRGREPIEAMILAGSEVAARQQSRVAIPKRFSLPMREIWEMQPRLEQRQGTRPHRLLGHPRLRAAYDFLVLRAAAGEADPELADWWTRFQEGSTHERTRMTDTGTKRRRRRRRPKDGSVAAVGTLDGD